VNFTYSTKAEANKPVNAQTISGLPHDIFLKFSKAYIRYYRGEYNGHFFCTLAIPTQTDSDGYVLEMEFVSQFFDEDNLDFSRYEVSLHEHAFESLPKSTSCIFEDKAEMGQRMLLLKMKIDGTPFNGYVLINRDLYNTSRL
jgi:hypothetical protein